MAGKTQEHLAGHTWPIAVLTQRQPSYDMPNTPAPVGVTIPQTKYGGNNLKITLTSYCVYAKTLVVDLSLPTVNGSVPQKAERCHALSSAVNSAHALANTRTRQMT